MGDLRIRFWKEPEDLHKLLIEEIEKLKEQLCRNASLDPDEFNAFDLTIGHFDSPYDASSWQVIAPMRGRPTGTRKLNATIQDHWHGWAKRAKRAPNGAYIRWPLKFGDEQVTLFDKVMQISNEWLPYWARSEKASKKPRTAVFNGQIGTVRELVAAPQAEEPPRVEGEGSTQIDLRRVRGPAR